MRNGILLSVLAALALTAVGCKQFTGSDPAKTEEALKTAAPCTMAWTDILSEYKRNDVRFEKETFPAKLKNTRVEWSGEVENISNKYAKIDIDGATGADVELFLSEADIMKLNEGEKVKFEGVITDWTRLSVDGFMLLVDGKIK